MTVTLSIVIFVALVVLLQVICEVFTILFMLTGLPEQKARFQVISLLTTSGYTTKESELIIDSDRRRNLAKTVMIFGYTFTATFVSIFVNVLINVGKNNTGGFWTWSFVVIAALIIILLLFRLKFFRKYIDRVILRLSSKLMFGKNSNYIMVIDDYVDTCVAEVKLRKLPKAFAGETTLEELKIKANYGIQILAIRRNDRLISNVDKDQKTLEGDLITVYGRLRTIVGMFDIKSGIHEDKKIISD